MFPIFRCNSICLKLLLYIRFIGVANDNDVVANDSGVVFFPIFQPSFYLGNKLLYFWFSADRKILGTDFQNSVRKFIILVFGQQFYCSSDSFNCLFKRLRTILESDLKLLMSSSNQGVILRYGMELRYSTVRFLEKVRYEITYGMFRKVRYVTEILHYFFCTLP